MRHILQTPVSVKGFRQKRKGRTPRIGNRAMKKDAGKRNRHRFLESFGDESVLLFFQILTGSHTTDLLEDPVEMVHVLKA